MHSISCQTAAANPVIRLLQSLRRLLTDRWACVFLAGVLAIGLGALSSASLSAQEAPRVMIVMDGSGSMWGRIGKQPKLKIAIRAVNQVMKRVPADLEVGLMAYGHRSEGDCGDIEVLVRPAENTARKIRRALGGMSFQGKTPLAASLREAAERLGYEDRPVTVVMVTDGIESCRMNPCKVAADLEAAGLDFTAHVIGFGLSAKEGARVSCIAKRTGGKYYPARNARALAQALTQAMFNEDAVQVVPEVATEDPDQPLAASEPGLATPDPATGKKKALAEVAPVYFRGAPVMMNVAIAPVGNIGIAAQAPAVQAFPSSGTISDCQNQCEGDPLCAAWRYDPAAAVGAQCVAFDYATAFDYAETDPAGGSVASGMKVAAVQLVRPYVPVPVAVAVVAAPLAAFEVTLQPTSIPADLALVWTATPMDDPEAAPILSDGGIVGPWTVVLAPGEWVIEGAAPGFILEDFISVSSTATAFEIEAFAVGDPGGDPVELAEDESGDMLQEDDPEPVSPDADADPGVEGIVQDTGTDATVVAPQEALVPDDPAATLALTGAGTASDAGYTCGPDATCGFQDVAASLVFALPPGWASDRPVFAANDPSGAIVMTLFGPEEPNGAVPTLLLNPPAWTLANGDCTNTAVGPLCIWGSATDATLAAVGIIAPSLVVATADVPAAEAGPPEPVAVVPLERGLIADGLWTPAVSAPVIANCAPGIEAGLGSAITALSTPRDVAWGGVFDPMRIGLNDEPLLLLNWSPVSDTEWQGETAPAPIPGQPTFVVGSVAVSLVLTDPETITGQLSLSAFATGGGMANLLSAGLSACRVTADVVLTRTGG